MIVRTPILVLTATTDTLEMVLDAAGTDVIAEVIYLDNYGTDIPQRTAKVITASTGASDVTILAAPPQASVSREVYAIVVYNGNAATRVVSIQTDENTTNRIHWKQSLLTTQTLQINETGASVI